MVTIRELLKNVVTIREYSAGTVVTISLVEKVVTNKSTAGKVMETISLLGK